MVEIYCGDGKGKTTAAVGLAVRAASHEIPVLFAQFLKDDTSGEIKLLRELKEIEVMHSPVFYGFVRNMSDEQKQEVKTAYSVFLGRIAEWAAANTSRTAPETYSMKYTLRESDEDNVTDAKASADNSPSCVIVLDEILHAINYGLADEAYLLEMIENHSDAEFVLTGWRPSPKITEAADYITEFNKQRHVYDKGVAARRGIEY